MKAGGRKKLAAVFAYIASAIVIATSALMPMTAEYVHAEELTAFDKTAIEEDLKAFELEGYPKDENSRHRLMDGGFMEYAYSEDAELSGKYYGLYFYVYNPTEREISERAGAHTVNMAVEYDAAGEPSDYDNLALTLLDETENHRFLKFKLTDGAGACARAKAYAQAHGGERRYDVAGVQLWFAGDQNATDSNTASYGEIEGKSSTFVCTGFSKGCGDDKEAESTLKIKENALETANLNIKTAYYRTGADTAGENKQNTISSVYFMVPSRFIREYEELEIVKAQWYEVKTQPIFVTDSEEIRDEILSWRGHELPLWTSGKGYYDSSVPFTIVEYLSPGDSGQQGWNYNYSQGGTKNISRFDWVIKTENILKPVSPEILKEYANTYYGKDGDARLEIGGKKLNVRLFSAEVDEGHKFGKNVHTFDVKNPEDRINVNLENTTSAWDKFCNSFKFGDSKYETFIKGENITPIEEITAEKLAGNKYEVEKKLLIDESLVEELQSYCAEAEKQGARVWLLRHSVTEYESHEMEYQKKGNHFGPYPKMYAATDTVFLDFDIIHLGFAKEGNLRIIPVVMSPIDIYPTLTPPPSMKSDGLPWWIWCTVAGGVLVLALIITLSAEKEAKK